MSSSSVVLVLVLHLLSLQNQNQSEDEARGRGRARARARGRNPMSEPNQPFGQSNIVKLSDEDATVVVLEHAVKGLWEVVNDLTRLRRTTRQNYRVTIFGSARLKPGTVAYEGVKKLAAELTGMGCDILTGGGPGLMQAANEGAHSADPTGHGRSVGINIELPFEQQVNPFVTQAFEHRTFFSRLHHFMIISDAFVVTPGGIGSLLE